MVPALYLHFPFCTASCAYCAFYSEPITHWKGIWPAYVERMRKEIRKAREKYGGFDTIFLGGGNPCSLPPQALATLLEEAGGSRETTVEMNPESLTDAYEPLFGEGLVNRVSMGVQSLDERTLRTLGRASTRSQTLEGISRLSHFQETYHFAINFDLIACVPGQTIADSVEDVRQLLSLSDPDHLSLYCLTLEPDTALARRVEKGQLRMIGEDEQADYLYTLWDYLKEHRYEHYEVSNFAKDGSYCLHNLHYWHLDPYVGLGSHAAGREPRRDGGMDATENSQDLRQYAAGVEESGYAIEHLTREEECEEYLLAGLRIVWGIDKARFRSRFGRSFDSVFSKQVAEIDRNLFVDDPRHFALTEKGMMVLDHVLLCLAQAL
ncbi:MAG: coproporphyrinogen-III oxidase family protein [Sphaerochaetaceae bacterium]|nr:coproporphyrinogen-III oxidase family protein [Spirochaetales bacterium]MDY5499571.1 coproporphyrinogen-III oxidase family protein [Sphaerochaetaceae bacterium]